jgi:hypothetical protein
MGDTEPAEVCKRKESLAAPISGGHGGYLF